MAAIGGPARPTSLLTGSYQRRWKKVVPSPLPVLDTRRRLVAVRRLGNGEACGQRQIWRTALFLVCGDRRGETTGPVAEPIKSKLGKSCHTLPRACFGIILVAWRAGCAKARKRALRYVNPGRAGAPPGKRAGCWTARRSGDAGKVVVQS